MPRRGDRGPATAASATVAAVVTSRTAARPPTLRAVPTPVVVVGACVAVAALSLLLVDQPAYDPMAWLIWGRQISEGFLETIAGPSWKPLPIVVTAPAAVVGDDPAVWAWLVVARTAGLLALYLAYRLAARLGGSPV